MKKLLLTALLTVSASLSFADDGSMIPYVKSDWKLMFKPEKSGNYINDHTLIKDPKGNWHFIGITRHGEKQGVAPAKERYLAHALGGNTLSSNLPFKELDKICDYGHKAWAPHAIKYNGTYYLYWGPDVLRLDTSKDLMTFKHEGVIMDPKKEHSKDIFRDTMTIRYKDKWLKYSTGKKGKYGTVDIWESTDLKKWKFLGPALTTSGKAPLNPQWGACESPYVVKNGDWFYLFFTYTDCGAWNYQNTLVFKSKNPTSFGDYDGDDDNVVTRIAAHAPEIVQENGKWFITSCGWNNYPVVKEGGVAIAELDWYKPGQEPENVKRKLEQSHSFEKQTAEMKNITLVAGKVGKAAKFNGKDSMIDLPDLYLNRDFTVSAWVKFEGNITNNDAILGQGKAGQDFNFNAGKLHIWGPKNIFVSKNQFKPDQWYHIALVRSNNYKLAFYVNGELDSEGLWSGCFQPKVIGKGNTPNSFEGLIDELKIFSHSINQNEVKKLMSK